MSDIAIKVEGLSKRYRIGLKEEMHDTFFGALTSWVKSPLANFKRLRKLSHFNDSAHPNNQQQTTNNLPHEIHGSDSRAHFIGANNPSQSDDIIWPVKDVSFEVKRGEVLGIIGKNGAGKSTLLKLLCRIVEPTSGDAFINGRVASLLEVGTGFHGELTGRENVFLNGTILGMSKSEVEKKFEEIVAFSGIGKFIDTPVKRYSSGMSVRLAFAVAAHLEPEILLIDEVLAVGDFEFQEKCLGKMRDVAGEGRTVLFVSHNMRAVKNLCSRAILLDRGQLVSNGPTSDVIDEYVGNVEKTNDLLPEITFPANPEKRFQIRAVRVLDDNGKPSIELDRTKPFTVSIDYDIRETTKIASVEFSIKTLDDTIIYHAADTDLAPGRAFERKKGSYTTSVEFPGYLLNAGKYIVNSFTRWGKPDYDQPFKNLVFHLNDYGTYASIVKNVVDSKGQRRGLLAIPLKWKTGRLEA